MEANENCKSLLDEIEQLRRERDEARRQCEVTGDGCVYFIPDSKRCAREFGEGPDARDGREESE